MGLDSPFEGRLIRLRAREPEDAPLLHAWFNDASVTEHLSMRYPLSHEQEERFVSGASVTGYFAANFAVVTRDDGRLIGGAELRDVSPENRTAILGITIGDKACWDGGYGTDTIRTICRFGFEMMNLNRIELDVFAENARARRVYEKVGFREEGVRRQAVYKYGRYQDVVVMGLLAGELALE